MAVPTLLVEAVGVSWARAKTLPNRRAIKIPVFRIERRSMIKLIIFVKVMCGGTEPAKGASCKIPLATRKMVFYPMIFDAGIFTAFGV